MEDSHDRAVNKPVDDFGERIAKLRADGVPSYPPLGGRMAWAETTERRKLDEIVWESWTVSHGSTTSGAATLETIERNVNYAGLPSVQREMLQDLRAKLDAGLLDGPLPDGRDLAGIELAGIVGVGHFDETLQACKADADRPWAEVPEDVKVRVLVDAAQDTGPPGAYTLAAIEREVDYSKLPVWRRAALEGLRARADRGDLGGAHSNPIDQGDRVEYALRMAEFEARIEEYKRLGALDANGARWPWRELSEEEKLHEIELEMTELHLGSESAAFEILAREVDLAQVPEWRRQAVASNWEEARAVPEGYERRLREESGEATMPTKEQMNAVAQKIEWLKSMSYLREAGHTPSAASDTALPWWEDLSRDEQQAVLKEDVDWSAFTEADQENVINRVLDGQEPDFWMDGVPIDSTPLKRAQAEVEALKARESNRTIGQTDDLGLGPDWAVIGTVDLGKWADWNETQRLVALNELVHWDGVSPAEKRAVFEREVDFMLVAPKDQQRILGEVWHQNDARPVGRVPDEPTHVADDIEWTGKQREAKIRELFDTANRVQFAEFLKEKALAPGIALRPAEQVRAEYYRLAEETWDSFLEEAEFRADTEIRETLELFKAKEGQLGGQAPKTLMDHLQAGGLFLNAGRAGVDEGSAPASIRDTTRNLVEAIWLDTWPRAGAVVDFGLDSQKHYEALYYPLRNGEITAEALDGALGHGEKLTSLTREAPSNPHKDVEFHTSWDVTLGRGRQPSKPEVAEAESNEQRPLPSPAEIALSHSTTDKSEASNGQTHGRDPDKGRRPKR